MLPRPLQTRKWSDVRLELRGWLTRAQLETGGEIDDVLLREFFRAVDVPAQSKHFLITVEQVNPEDLP